MEAETQNIFILGLAILFGWMVVILICASPQLFRNCVTRRCCARNSRHEKIKEAEARLQATLKLAEKPSTFLLGQVVALSQIDSHLHRSSDISLEELEEGELFENEPGPSTA